MPFNCIKKSSIVLRFGWKYKSRNNAPFVKLVNEAGALKENWPPIKAGMFGDSYERFEAVANEFKEILGRLNGL